MNSLHTATTIRHVAFVTFAVLGPAFSGCSGSDANPAAAGGSSASGGAVSTGGSATGVSTGGSAAGASSGGARATGGNATGTTGGTFGAGGTSSPATGGSTSTGTAGTGGLSATGGVAPTGGAASSGGAATGGKSSSGTNTGGAATGGKSATGGSTTNGGAATGGAATGGKSATGGAATGGAATGGKSATGGTSTGGTGTGCRSLPDLGVRFVGRVDACDPNGVRMAWSGTGFIGKFSGTGVSVHLNDSANQYTVLIDGTLMPTLKTVAGDNTYSLASGLANAAHTVEFYRRTEASFGTTVVIGVTAAGTGQMLAPPAAHTRLIEIVGDSITCGYGDEGVLGCSFSADTENSYLAYGSILARDLSAEASTVAWSGKGIYFNYNADRVDPLPSLYDYTIPSDKQHVWSFLPQPDLVIINLGTNDYSTATVPTTTQFVSAYQAFLEHIRGKYPAAYILCTMGPLLSGTALTTVRTNIGTAIAARASAGDTKVKYHEITTANTNPGCDYHPGLATQAAMAAELEVEIKSDLGW